MKRNKTVIDRLNKLGQRRENEGYTGDAAEYWFKANVLTLLENLLKEFKGIEKQMKYLWQNLDDLKKDEQ